MRGACVAISACVAMNPANGCSAEEVQLGATDDWICEEPSLFGNAASTPIESKPDVTLIQKSLLAGRYKSLFLSPIVETSKEQLATKSNAEASNSNQKLALSGHVVAASLPPLQTEAVVKLGLDSYTVEGCIGCGNLFRMLPTSSEHPAVVGRLMATTEDAERTVSMKIVRLLRSASSTNADASGMLLPADWYTFANGCLMVYPNFDRLTWADLCCLLKDRKMRLEEETYAVFVFEMLRILAFLESVNVAHGAISEDNLIIFGDLRPYSLAAGEHFANTPTCVVKLADFDSTVPAETSDRASVLSALCALIVGQRPAEIDADRWRRCIPHYWDRMTWMKFFFDLQASVKKNVPLDGHISQFQKIFRHGIRMAMLELKNVCALLHGNVS